MRKNDPAEIFDRATEFHRTLDVLSEEAKRIDFPPFLLYPRIVLNAFTCEVYFKCLHSIHNDGLTPEGHDLLGLFNSLDGRSRTFIEVFWENNQAHKTAIVVLSSKSGKPLKTSLVWCLEQGANHFKEFRYAYEKNPQGPSLLGPLPDILRTLIINTKREWQNRSAMFIERPEHWPAPRTPPTS